MTGAEIFDCQRYFPSEFLALRIENTTFVRKVNLHISHLFCSRSFARIFVANPEIDVEALLTISFSRETFLVFSKKFCQKSPEKTCCRRSFRNVVPQCCSAMLFRNVVPQCSANLRNVVINFFIPTHASP